jgi:HlyD family secretion protein
LAEDKNERDFLLKLSGEFEIKAPEDGMVIYVREYDGQKKTEGSNIGAWDPTVATLPDLTTMLSTTYVNEVDIRKVNEGQSVKIGLDAFPEKKLTGKVVSVANVGEQRPNSDAKVFEVQVEVHETDTTLRPAMTTSNEIITDVVPEAIYVPLESIFTSGDSLTYVYKRNGLDIVKQEVRLGKANANEIVILNGIELGEKVFLSAPNGLEEEEVLRLEKATE